MGHSGFDSLPDQLQKALSGEGEKKQENENGGFDNKDFEEVDLLGSPISPLVLTRKSQLGGLTTSTCTTTATSSSSSSSGSVSGRLLTGPGNLYLRHSGELSASVESSPTGLRGGGGSGSSRPDSGRSGSSRAGNVGSSRGSGSGRAESGRSSGGSGFARASGGSGSGRTESGRSSGGSGSGRSESGRSSGGSSSGRPESVRGSGGSGSVRAENVRGSGGSGAGSVRGGHGRSDSCWNQSMSYASGGGAAVNSPVVSHVTPGGNIYPSGIVVTTGLLNQTTRSDVLGSGGNYGHGSIMMGGVGARPSGGESSNQMRPISKVNDPEELKRLGNDNYMKGNYSEALSFYDKAIKISPGNAIIHCNRAASLVALKRLPQAMKECEEAIRLNPDYARAHRRLGLLFLSLGLVENARMHLSFPGAQAEANEMQKLQIMEMHMRKCGDARKNGDWGSALRETDSLIASADFSPQLVACRAEALLKLHRVDDASRALSDVPKFEPITVSYSQSKFFGMLCEAYISAVRAQIELAQGRFEDAVTAIEKAAELNPGNHEITGLLKHVRLVVRARTRGNNLFKLEKFTEACAAYGEGLKVDSSNSILYCNRAACWYKLGEWESSLADCDQALSLQPNYWKALLRRADSYGKLERWAEAVKDYEVLKKAITYENDIAEQMFHAQVALRKSRGEDVSNMKFGGKVELVSSVEQFRAAVSSPIASVVLFKSASDPKCKQVSQFLDSLCSRYPSMSFLMVDVKESQAIANSENIKIVPTVKIYKSGSRVKDMVLPNPEVLESSVRHYRW